jgi:hypothetical protein
MEEPERILNKTNSSLERTLLLEGRRYEAPDGVRVRTLAAVGLAASAGVGTGLLAWLSSKSLAAKLALAFSTTTAITALPVTYLLSTRGETAPARHGAAPAAVVAPAPTEPVVPTPVVNAPAPLPAADRALPPSAPPVVRTSSTNNLALRAELAALDAIRSRLANDDPAGALSFVAAYFRSFPRGRLHLEAEVLRIDALAKAGQAQAAKRHAREFIKQHPNSVLSARVRSYAGN